MSQLFDCSFQLRIAGPDPDELHLLIRSFQRLADERDEVLGALFANGSDGERVDLTLSVEDVATARRLAKDIQAEIEQFLVVRFGLDAVRSEAVVIRELPTASSTNRLGTPLEDGFEERLVARLRQFRREPIEDPVARIRALGTCGPSGHPTTEDILAKLDEWRVYSTFDVVDVGRTNVALYFRELPQQLHRFAEEVLLFCPAVTDEVDDLDELEHAAPAVVARIATEGIAANLRTDPTLRMWWD